MKRKNQDIFDIPGDSMEGVSEAAKLLRGFVSRVDGQSTDKDGQQPLFQTGEVETWSPPEKSKDTKDTKEEAAFFIQTEEAEIPKNSPLLEGHAQQIVTQMEQQSHSLPTRQDPSHKPQPIQMDELEEGDEPEEGDDVEVSYRFSTLAEPSEEPKTPENLLDSLELHVPEDLTQTIPTISRFDAGLLEEEEAQLYESNDTSLSQEIASIFSETGAESLDELDDATISMDSLVVAVEVEHAEEAFVPATLVDGEMTSLPFAKSLRISTDLDDLEDAHFSFDDEETLFSKEANVGSASPSDSLLDEASEGIGGLDSFELDSSGLDASSKASEETKASPSTVQNAKTIPDVAPLVLEPTEQLDALLSSDGDAISVSVVSMDGLSGLENDNVSLDDLSEEDLGVEIPKMLPTPPPNTLDPETLRASNAAVVANPPAETFLSKGNVDSEERLVPRNSESKVTRPLRPFIGPKEDEVVVGEKDPSISGPDEPTLPREPIPQELLDRIAKEKEFAQQVDADDLALLNVISEAASEEMTEASEVFGNSESVGQLPVDSKESSAVLLAERITDESTENLGAIGEDEPLLLTMRSGSFDALEIQAHELKTNDVKENESADADGVRGDSDKVAEISEDREEEEDLLEIDEPVLLTVVKAAVTGRGSEPEDEPSSVEASEPEATQGSEVLGNIETSAKVEEANEEVFVESIETSKKIEGLGEEASEDVEEASEGVFVEKDEVSAKVEEENEASKEKVETSEEKVETSEEKAGVFAKKAETSEEVEASEEVEEASEEVFVEKREASAEIEGFAEIEAGKEIESNEESESSAISSESNIASKSTEKAAVVARAPFAEEEGAEEASTLGTVGSLERSEEAKEAIDAKSEDEERSTASELQALEEAEKAEAAEAKELDEKETSVSTSSESLDDPMAALEEAEKAENAAAEKLDDAPSVLLEGPSAEFNLDEFDAFSNDFFDSPVDDPSFAAEREYNDLLLRQQKERKEVRNRLFVILPLILLFAIAMFVLIRMYAKPQYVSKKEEFGYTAKTSKEKSRSAPPVRRVDTTPNQGSSEQGSQKEGSQESKATDQKTPAIAPPLERPTTKKPTIRESGAKKPSRPPVKRASEKPEVRAPKQRAPKASSEAQRATLQPRVRPEQRATKSRPTPEKRRPVSKTKNVEPRPEARGPEKRRPEPVLAVPAAKSNPKASRKYFLRGTQEFFSGKAGRAERSLRRSIQEDPKNANPYRVLVLLYVQKKDKAKAQTALQKFKSMAPKSPFVRVLQKQVSSLR